MIHLKQEPMPVKDFGLVSVIIPVYNVRLYLEEALDSVVHQTYRNLEIILVDDGSDDGSGETCGRYAERDSRIRVIRRDHQGPGAARNAALNVMRGEYVAFLDADDAFLPEMIETLLTALEREQADMAVCRYAECNTEKRLDPAEAGEAKPTVPPGVYTRDDYLRAMMEDDLSAYLWNRLYRAEIWKEIRFPAGRVFEDVAVAARIYGKAARVAVLPEMLVLYRRHRTSITQTESVQNFRDRLAAFAEFDAFMEQNTPGIFSAEQLQNTRRARLEMFLWRYSRLPAGEELPPEEMKRFRRRILDLGRATGGRGCGFRVRCGWQLFRISPRLLRALYGIYYAVYAKHVENKH